jgi:kdpD
MEERGRPDPDALLRQLSRQKAEPGRGRLKIFFGYAAGVGKTYAMLEAAQAAKRAGVDVVAGYIEPHARPETSAMAEGIEALPTLTVTHKGLTLHEFDLDAALRRRPQLLLVDELAHTNAEGCRHRKRYQDVEELLRAGISVFTTINVQHLESLNDIVASITGVVVRERIPDSVFDSADQVELVDIEPDDLLTRMSEGKIYREGQAERAKSHFFTLENLVALREIALRRTADRVTRVAEKVQDPARAGDYYTGEHILICLSSAPSNAKVIRTASRMAEALHAAFTALFVETPDTTELNDANRARLRENLKLAEQLGARIATVYGQDVAFQISEYAKVSGVSKIVIGRSNNKRGWLYTKPTLVERLTALAPNLDIYIIPDNRPPYQKRRALPLKSFSFSAADFLKMLGLLAASTLVAFFFFRLGFTEPNIITVYILGVLGTALWTSGWIYSALSSILSVLAFNFLFTEPYYSLNAYDSGYPVTFLVMFAASLLISTLTTRVKVQARLSSLKAHRTEVLLETSRKLQRASGRDEILKESAAQLIRLLERTVILYPVEEEGLGAPRVYPCGGEPDERYTAPDERAVAQWVYRNNKHAGATTNTLPGAKCLYLAVRGRDTVHAVAAVVMEEGAALDPFDKNLLLAMLGEIGLALEKETTQEASRKIAMEAEKEKLRANLLRAISHDLRTPLTSISGSAGMLMADAGHLSEEKKHDMYVDIYDDSMWLFNLVENLLSVTRLDNGSLQLRLEPELLDEVIGEALRHLSRRSTEHPISVELQDDLLMARMDSRLIVQVMINIVNNAVQYTPPGSPIRVSARKQGRQVLVEIADNGPGISDEDKDRLFDMFYTAGNTRGDGRRGLGLGLSLCKSIVSAHGGVIEVRDNSPHGTIFSFTLPLEEISGLQDAPSEREADS